MLTKIPEDKLPQFWAALSILSEIGLAVCIPIHWILATVAWILNQFIHLKKESYLRPIIEVKAV